MLNSIKWDAYLIYKYGIATVAIVISALNCVAIALYHTQVSEKLIVVLIFSDPVMYGFLFTAIMLLFEKDSGTLPVLAITPLTNRRYILSKALTFSILSLIISLPIIIVAQPSEFHLLWFILAVVLSSALFIFVAIIGVSFVKNFNQFILIIPIVLAPVCLPFLNFFGLMEGFWFYLIPTQACLILFQASTGYVLPFEIIYAIIYLVLLIGFTYRWALISYQKRILKTSKS